MDKQNAFCSTCYYHFCEACLLSGQINHRHFDGALTLCTWIERRAPLGPLVKGDVICDICKDGEYSYRFVYAGPTDV
jgi:hypothetical protein